MATLEQLKAVRQDRWVGQIVTVQGSGGEYRTGTIASIDWAMETFELRAYGRYFTYRLDEIQ